MIAEPDGIEIGPELEFPEYVAVPDVSVTLSADAVEFWNTQNAPSVIPVMDAGSVMPVMPVLVMEYVVPSDAVVTVMDVPDDTADKLKLPLPLGPGVVPPPHPRNPVGPIGPVHPSAPCIPSIPVIPVAPVGAPIAKAYAIY